MKSPQAQRVLPPPPPWCLTDTNNGRWIWWICKNSVDGIRGTNILLNVIDVLSKYAWAVPIQSKSSQYMIKWLEAIRRQASPRWPRLLQTDQGKEFYNAGSKPGSRNTTRIIFRRMGIVNPPCGTMASYLETAHVPLLHRPRYVEVLGCVTTVD